MAKAKAKEKTRAQAKTKAQTKTRAQEKAKSSSKALSFEDKLLKSLMQVPKSWVQSASVGKTPPAQSVRVVLFANSVRPEQIGIYLKSLTQWQIEQLKRSDEAVIALHGDNGPLWIVRPWLHEAAWPQNSHTGELDRSAYARCRDSLGSALSVVLAGSPASVWIDFADGGKDEVLGGLVGLELARYKFKLVTNGQTETERPLFLSRGKGALSVEWLSSAAAIAGGVNVARHLVNLPPQTLNPRTYAELLSQFFKGKKSIQVEVWQPDRLKKENMGLLLAVGAGAAEKPRLVHIKYRPSKASGKPVALVGKGITFDSGGLDIKPSSGMRLMKKDMGGSAALVGFAYWLSEAQPKQAYDIYLSLAENSVSADAFRPSDVLRSRGGQTVEVHNTDAEGRLALADALDVAVTKTGKDAPSAVIDVATLTGAVKVGLGSEVAGLFSNNDAVANKLLRGAHKRGELFWRLPLYQRMRRQMASTVADMTNCTDGFGGAISAALFLESFVRGKPWVHLDIYAWQDAAEGAYSEPGGSGQAVQALIGFAEM